MNDFEEPAFPVVGYPTPQGGTLWQPGMSLRDWFAGQVLIGVLSSPHTIACGDTALKRFDSTLAERVYQVADAMLAERAKRG